MDWITPSCLTYDMKHDFLGWWTDRVCEEINALVDVEWVYFNLYMFAYEWFFLICKIVYRRVLCISPLSFMVPSKTSHKLPSVHKRHPLLFYSPPCIRAWTYTLVVLYKCNCCSQFDFNFCCCSILVYASLEQLQHALVQITCIQNNSHKQMNIWTVLNLNNTWADKYNYIINPYLYPHP